MPAPETRNPRAATPAVPAKKNPSAAERLKENPSPQQADPNAPLTPEEEKAAVTAEEAAKVEAQAAEKAGRINSNLIKDGSTRRLMGGVRDGKPKFFWGNFVPTQELTDEELKAAESMK